MRMPILLIFLTLALFAKERTMEIKLSFDNNELFISLDENAASKQFYEMLPLELEFSDYAEKEKVARLVKKLSLSNTQEYDPQVGDFFYFSPWGNIGIFYEKQPPYNGIVYLGKLKSDISKVKNIKGKVLIQKYE